MICKDKIHQFHHNTQKKLFDDSVQGPATVCKFSKWLSWVQQHGANCMSASQFKDDEKGTVMLSIE